MTIKARLANRGITARVLASFPAQVLAGTGITINKSGLSYTFSLNASAFSVNSNPADTDYLLGLSGTSFYKVTYAELVSDVVAEVGVAAWGSITGTLSAQTDLQTALDAKQPLDATLTSLAALGTASDKFAYTTGVDTWAEANITAAGRALIDDADATAQRTTLGLGTAATQNTGTSGANLPFLNGANTWSAAQTIQGLLDLNHASGGQIKFPATQNASSDANTLDDYEEGTSTPTPTAGSGSFTTVSATVKYTKVGSQVTATVRVVVTNNGTAAGRVLVTLPIANGANACAGGGFNENNANLVSGYLGASGSTLEIYKYDGTYPIATGQSMVCTITYLT